jgi:hypothetical protein
MKSWQQALQGEELPPTVRYLKSYKNQNGKKIVFSGFSIEEILRVLQATSAGKVARAFERLDKRTKNHSITKAFGLTGIELAEAARAHCQLYIFESFLNYVETCSKYCSKSLHSVLVDLLILYGVDLLTKSLGNILQVNILNYKLIQFNINLLFFKSLLTCHLMILKHLKLNLKHH